MAQVNIMGFITRIRGNPVALATLLVAIAAAVAGFWVASPSRDVLAGALVGASVSSVVALLINFLGEPDIRAIPRRFIEAAKHDIENTGYYRSQSQFSIRLHSIEINTKLEPTRIEIIMSSKIVPTRENVKVERPKIDPPKGLRLFKDKYTLDDLTIPAEGDFPLDRMRREKLHVVYEIADQSAAIYTDSHRWTCPVDGFILTARLLDGFGIEAFRLAGDGRQSLLEEPSHSESERVFRHQEGAFSNQGFRWKIVRAA